MTLFLENEPLATVIRDHEEELRSMGRRIVALKSNRTHLVEALVNLMSMLPTQAECESRNWTATAIRIKAARDAIRGCHEEA